jgi:hypothetical protein
MKIFRLINVALAILFAGTLQAQVKQDMGWFASFNTIKVAPKWSIHAEIQLRSTDKWAQVQSVLPRVGLNYHLGTKQILTAGYAFIPARFTVGGASSLLGEHRIFQQYIYNQPVKNTAIQHRFRLEERFIPKATLLNDEVKIAERVYTTRLRYFVRTIIPFTSQKPFVKGAFFALQNEIFVALTDKQNVNGRIFDQNRGYLAIGYRVSKKLDVEVGYLNQYVQRAKGQQNLMNHIAQLAVYTRL